eukprot:TRINITY_DN5682_c0_g1_i1.p1 TRINITY_DN5682_c0_g1~~TRINITY_DN5682_c0_g1_i1.p1  ORF type:complete len:516 (+),score=92.99 TRINITY_DN5682_c0_g1_i1:103-1650(+)
MDKTWKCSSCNVLYFTRTATTKHITEAHAEDPNAKPIRTRPVNKPLNDPITALPGERQEPRKTPQLKICRTSKEVKELLWNHSVEYSIVLHPAMTSLNLSNVAVKASKLVSILGGTNLTSLNLSSTNLRDSGLRTVIESLSTTPSSLLHLNLADNEITLNGLKYIGKFLQRTSLRTLDLSKNGFSLTEHVVDLLKNNKTLTSFGIAGIPAASSGAVEELANLLATNSSLTHLDISGIDLGSQEATWIGEALKKNSTLTSLSMFGEVDVSSGVIPVFEALEHNSTLRQLVLWGSQRDDFNEKTTGNAVDAICNALKNNRNLTELSFLSPKRKDKIKLGTQSLSILGEFLRSNSTLKSFAVSSCDELSDTKYIADALKYNTTLTSLSLQANTVDLESFASALVDPETKSPLISLHLSHTRDFFFQYFITPNEGWSVNTACRVLKACNALESMDVPVYVDSSAEAEILLGLMWHNSKLTNFNINFDRLNSYNKETMKYYKSSGSTSSPSTFLFVFISC